MTCTLILAAIRALQAGANTAQTPGQDPIVLEAYRRLVLISRLQGHPDQAGLSSAQHALVKPKPALLSIESVLRMRGERPTGQLTEFSANLLNAAAIQLEPGNTAPAKELLTQALSVSEKTLPPDSPQLPPVLDALANLLRDGAEYAERIREASFGPNSAELLSTLDSLAYVYLRLERYAEAQPVYERLLSLWESSAGPGHPMVFVAQHRYADAEPLAARAMAMRTESLIESLSRVRLAESKPDEAEAIEQRITPPPLREVSGKRKP